MKKTTPKTEPPKTEPPKTEPPEIVTPEMVAQLQDWFEQYRTMQKHVKAARREAGDLLCTLHSQFTDLYPRRHAEKRPPDVQEEMNTLYEATENYRQGKGDFPSQSVRQVVSRMTHKTRELLSDVNSLQSTAQSNAQAYQRERQRANDATKKIAAVDALMRKRLALAPDATWTEEDLARVFYDAESFQTFLRGRVTP